MHNFLKLGVALCLAWFLSLAGTMGTFAAIGFGSYTNGMTNPPSGNASTTLVIARRADASTGDLLLAQISFDKGSDVTTITSPSGWSLVLCTNHGSDIGQAIYHKVATENEPDSYSWNFSQSVKAAGGILRYTGVDVSSPIIAYSGNSGDSKTLTAISINSTETNYRLIAFFGIKKKNASLSTPTGMTQTYLYQNPQDVRIKAADELRTKAGDTGNRVSRSRDSEKWVAHLIALRPATVTATYTLTYTARPNGSISGTSPQRVNSGSDGTAVTAVPDTGYDFVNWSDGSTANPRTDTNVIADITVTARFAVKTFTIAASAGTGGSISPSGYVKVDSGADQTFTITPATGYNATDVMADGVAQGTITSYTFNKVSANHTISANFSQNPAQFTLTINTVGQGNVSIVPSKTTYNAEEPVQLIATPASGWSFTSWSGDLPGTTSPATITMNGNKTITATFTLATSPTPPAITSLPSPPHPPIPAPLEVGGGVGGGQAERQYLTQYLNPNQPGVFISEAFVKTWDGLLRLNIPKGTTGKTVEGWALSYIVVEPVRQEDQKLIPPEGGNIIGRTYKLEPDGVTFSPSITITMLYNEPLISEGPYEKDLVIGYWDTVKRQWEGLESCVVDTITNQITAPFSHFSTYAILYIPTKVTPASFSIGNLTVSPSETKVGQKVSISTAVTNTGGSPGDYTVSLKINNLQVESREISLDPGQSQLVQFSTKSDSSGKYTLDINGRTGQIIIREPEGEIAGLTSTIPSPVKTPPMASPSRVAMETPVMTANPASPEPAPTNAETEKASEPSMWIVLFGVMCTAVIMSGILLLLRRHNA